MCLSLCRLDNLQGRFLKYRTAAQRHLGNQEKCTFLGTNLAPVDQKLRNAPLTCSFMSLPSGAHTHSGLKTTDLNYLRILLALWI